MPVVNMQLLFGQWSVCTVSEKGRQELTSLNKILHLSSMLSARWSSIIYPHPTRSFFSNSFSIHFSRSYFTQSFSESGLLFAIGCSHQWSRLSCCCICVLLSPSHSFYDLHTNCSHQVVVVVSLFSSGLHTASMIFTPTVHIRLLSSYLCSHLAFTQLLWSSHQLFTSGLNLKEGKKNKQTIYRRNILW